jgi:hypothetical protein
MELSVFHGGSVQMCILFLGVDASCIADALEIINVSSERKLNFRNVALGLK